MSKEVLRREVQAALKLLSLEEQCQRSQEILKRFLQELLPFDQEPLVVGLYLPFEFEVKLLPLAEMGSWRILFPRIASETELEFVQASPGRSEDWLEGPWRKPHPSLSSVVPQERDLDLIIVPGLGFGRNGERLGRGKGYYDRFLAKSSALRVAFAYDCQILSTIPMDSWDEEVDWIVTETTQFQTPRLEFWKKERHRA